MASMRRLVVVLAVAGAGLVPAPATAAGFCSGTGVSVVVDFGSLDGGIQKGCDASGNRNAAKAFVNTGHPLTYAQRQPGFVCRVDGVPTSDPCVNTSPADAYWGLYWSDGTSGWKYASSAVGSLTVPTGATVAFSWQDGGGDPPGTAPAPLPSSPSPSPRPTRTPTTSRPSATAHTSAASTPSGSATSSPTGSASASPSASVSTSSSPTASASPTPSESASTAVAGGTEDVQVDRSAESDGGLPWWLPVGLIAALGAVSAVVWRVRRARP